MIHCIFSVYDAKAEAYLPPFILPKTEMAQRVFSDCVNSEDHQFGRHPADYTLFHLGTFDDITGEFEPHRNVKQSLGSGVEYVDLSHQSADRSNGQAFSDAAPVLPGTEGRDSS